MKRIMTVLALSVVAAAPAAAQLAGMPVWNSPKGGTGVTINGDLGMPNNNGGKGTAFGARATVGLANLSLTAGLASWKPSGASNSVTSVGGNAAFKIIGGSLIPLAVNFQVARPAVSCRLARPSEPRTPNAVPLPPFALGMARSPLMVTPVPPLGLFQTGMPNH